MKCIILDKGKEKEKKKRLIQDEAYIIMYVVSCTVVSDSL